MSSATWLCLRCGKKFYSQGAMDEHQFNHDLLDKAVDKILNAKLDPLKDQFETHFCWKWK